MTANPNDSLSDVLSDRVIETDALVIGAGPVGLFQVFQLGLQGISAQLVDALPVPGGQCIELYADKPIYDIPALPVCTGRELVARLLQQIQPFAPRFHGGQTVTTLAVQPDGRLALATSRGQRFVSRSVFIAGGVGAFAPRPLKVDGAERLLGSQLFYQPQDTGPAVRTATQTATQTATPTSTHSAAHAAAYSVAGKQLVVVGGDDAAIDATLALVDQASVAAPAQRPASITLLHRRDALSGKPAALARIQALCDTGDLRFEVGQIVAIETTEAPDPPMVAVQVIGDDGSPRRLPADLLLVLLGLSPKLGPIAQWGLAMQRRQLLVDPAHFETSTPGIYAVGDVVSYPGKKKLILCGFHEATLATFAALARLRPDEPTLLQYTTTSVRLQQRLGVAPTSAAD